MGILLAFAVGYAIGARAGSQDFDDVVQSINAIRESEEFGNFVMALRSHVGHTLREVAAIVDGTGSEMVSTQDLVQRVKSLIGR